MVNQNRIIQFKRVDGSLVFEKLDDLLALDFGPSALLSLTVMGSYPPTGQRLYATIRELYGCDDWAACCEIGCGVELGWKKFMTAAKRTQMLELRKAAVVRDEMMEGFVRYGLGVSSIKPTKKEYKIVRDKLFSPNLWATGTIFWRRSFDRQRMEALLRSEATAELFKPDGYAICFKR